MSTLFGRNKRTKTTRTASDGGDLEGSSVPYASTATPTARPQTISSNASRSGEAGRSSVYSVYDESGQPVPIHGRDISIPVNLIPERMPYDAGESSSAGTSSRHRTSETANGHLRRHDSQSTDGGRSTYSDNSATPHKKRHTDRLMQDDGDSRRRPGSTASSASSSSSSHRGVGGFVSPSDFTPRASTSRGANAEERLSTVSSRASELTTSSTNSLRESRNSAATLYSPNLRQLQQSQAMPHYPYNQSAVGATPNPAYSPAPSSHSHQQSSHNSSYFKSSSHTSTPSLHSHRSSSSLQTTPTLPSTPSFASGEFEFPRPADDREIEDLFDDLLERKNVPEKDRPGMSAGYSIQKKWALVHNDRLLEWQTARKATQSAANNTHRASLAPSLMSSSGGGDNTSRADQQGAAALMAASGGMRVLRGKTETPEWYLQKILNQTITPADVGSLTVALRTYEMAWVKSFIELQGLSVLSNVLANITRLPHPRKDQDTKLELELLKCLKWLLNVKVGVEDAMAHPNCIYNIALAMLTPNITARKWTLDMLVFMCHWTPPLGHHLVVRAFDSLMNATGDHARFDAWFAILEATLDGRGKMGSLVGASDEIRTLRGREAQQAMQAANDPSGFAGAETALNEYALTNLFLVNALIFIPEDYEIRVHLRGQMEASGLRRILTKMKHLNHPQIDRQISQYEERAEFDYELVIERHNETVLRDFQDPWDVFRALLASVEGSRAHDFFVSALQHLLLIREEGEQRVRYFQLIDNLITSVVLDRKSLERDFTSVLGVSVASLASRFADQERLQEEESKSKTLKLLVNQLKREKKEIEGQLAEKDEGVVGELQTKLFKVEEDLSTSRQASDLLKNKIDDMAKEHQEQLAQQDLQIRALFDMLKESRSLEDIQDDSGLLDRRELMGFVEKKVARLKTMHQLEGRHLSQPAPQASESGPWDQFSKVDKSTRAVELASPLQDAERKPKKREVRQSAFEDADEKTEMRRHIERTLAAGTMQLGLPGNRAATASPQSTRARDRIRGGTPTPSGAKPHMQYSPQSSSAGKPSSERSAAQQALVNLQSSPSPSPSPTPATSSAALPKGRFGSPAALPLNLLAEIKLKTSGNQIDQDTESDSTDTRESIARSDETAATSVRSTRESVSGTPERPVKSHKRTPTAESYDGSAPSFSSLNPKSPKRSSTAPPAPPPPAPPAPPAPPPPPALPRTLSSPSPVPSAAGAPPPPAPPPPPKAPAGPMQPAGLLSAIAGGAKLKPGKDRKVALAPDSRIIGNDKVVGPAGSSISPPPAGVWVPPPPGAPGMAPPPPAVFVGKTLAAPRKDGITARIQMKQVVWEKINPLQMEKTIWGSKDIDEEQFIKRMQAEGIFEQMEEDFQAKKAAQKAAAKKKDDLVSVLNAKTRERIEILLKNHSKDPDPAGKVADISRRIYEYDESLCTEHFLGELKAMLPGREEAGKLGQYRTADDSVLATLHVADRFLVELYRRDKDHLSDRVDGMLYRSSFAENLATHSKNVSTVYKAATAMQSAEHFGQLLRLMLILGNFMNGTGYNGGAFGFKISSINRLVDTKAKSGATLLHSLETIVTTQFPETKQFLEELEMPVAASRLNLAEIRRGFTEMRSKLKEVNDRLHKNYDNILDSFDSEDGYPIKMFRFTAEAKSSLESLADKITLTETTYSNVLSFFGENSDKDNMMATIDFFGQLAEFVASYRALQRIQAENLALSEQKAASEKRKAARAEKQAAPSAAQTAEPELAVDGQMMDDLFSKLRQGQDLGRKGQRRARRAHGERLLNISSKDANAGIVSPDAPGSAGSASSPRSLDVDPALAARGMLAQMKGGDFDIVPASPRPEKERRTLRPLPNLMSTVMESQETLKVPRSESSDRNLSASEYSASESEADEGLSSKEPPLNDDSTAANGEDSDMVQSGDDVPDDTTARLDGPHRSEEHLATIQSATSGDSSFVLDDLSPEEAIAAGLA